MRDLEQELVDTLARGYDSNGQPREGFFTLTHRMENEAEDQLDVDTTVLDFLMHKAISAAFEWYAKPDKYDSDLPNALITMTAEWRSFLSQKHKGSRLSSVVAFRSRLLQFVLLLTHRYHPNQTWTNEESLRQLKQQNADRGRLWSTVHSSKKEHVSSGHVLTEGTVEAARQSRASDLHLPSSFTMDRFNEPDRPTLDQILPVFIELTAARAGLKEEWQPTSEWYDLAGQFMLQAVIDAYVVHGHCSKDTHAAIFAFGSPGAASNGERPDIAAMRTLFCKDGSPAAEHAGWTATRARYMKESYLPTSFEATVSCHPYATFERSLLSFLQHLHDSVAKPDLMQVEEGRINIDGEELSRVESREMINRMGL